MICVRLEGDIVMICSPGSIILYPYGPQSFRMPIDSKYSVALSYSQGISIVDTVPIVAFYLSIGSGSLKTASTQ